MPGQSPSIDELLQDARWVRALARQLCRDAHAAEDAAQEVWAAVLRAPPRHARNPRGFLARVLRNAVALGRRGERRRVAREAGAAARREPASESAAELVARAELHRFLVARVLELDEPQREVVLRYHFEEQPVAAIARHLRTSPDAVRAHLRRARLTLRQRLEARDGDARAAFAAQLAADPPALATGLVAPATLLGAYVMNTKLVLASAASVAALCLVAPFVLSGESGSSSDAVLAACAASRVAAAGGPRNASPPEVDRVAVEAVEPHRPALRFRLEGLVAEAPWTAPIRARFAGDEDRRHEESRVGVAADGGFALAPPPWAREAAGFRLKLEANDEHYVALETELGPEARAATEPIPIRVEVASVLTGTVVDPVGAGVPAARVYAFAFDGRTAVDPPRAVANTRDDGSWRLAVTVAGPLLLLAVPMGTGQVSGRPWRGEDGALADSGAPRDDLVPACARVEGCFGAVTRVEPLRVTAPAWITGAVLADDGTPCAGRGVVWFHAQADAGLYEESLGNLAAWYEGLGGRLARARTDAAGRFRLPATPGKVGFCRVLDARGLADPLVDPVRVTAPAEVAFRLGGRTVVRVVAGGRPVAGAALRILTSPIEAVHTDERGEASFQRAGNESFRLWVEAPLRAEAEVEVPPVALHVVEVAPLGAPVDVELEIEGERFVRQAVLEWRPSGRDGVPLRLEALRNDGTGPFRIAVPTGRYELVVEASGRAERSDTFLLRQAQPVEVGPRGGAVRVRVAHGGRVRVTATDASGRYVSGYGMPDLVGPGGAGYRLAGKGVLESENLPAGSYELRLPGPNGRHLQRPVVVKACEVTDVRAVVP